MRQRRGEILICVLYACAESRMRLREEKETGVGGAKLLDRIVERESLLDIVL